MCLTLVQQIDHEEIAARSSSQAFDINMKATTATTTTKTTTHEPEDHDSRKTKQKTRYVAESTSEGPKLRQHMLQWQPCSPFWLGPRIHGDAIKELYRASGKLARRARAKAL